MKNKGKKLDYMQKKCIFCGMTTCDLRVFMHKNSKEIKNSRSTEREFWGIDPQIGKSLLIDM